MKIWERNLRARLELPSQVLTEIERCEYGLSVAPSAAVKMKWEMKLQILRRILAEMTQAKLPLT